MSESRTTRKLAAIINGDVVGYSRLMARDEDRTIATLHDLRELIQLLVDSHNGELNDFTGDNFLAQFPSTVDSMECALAIQTSVESRNADIHSDEQMRFRIGAHVGDIRVESGRIYGSGVNVAARLEALAEPGGICLSQQMLDLVSDKLELAVQDHGPQNVKNIPKPIRAYRISPNRHNAAVEEPAEHAAIRDHLIEVLNSVIFEKAPRQQRFLKHIVDNMLAGNESNLKGYAIGLEVFDRADDFDPAVDSIVRVEATRLRAKLREYYDTIEASGAVKIELPKGSYAPRFKTANEPQTATASAPANSDRSTTHDEKPSLIVLPFTNLSNDKDQEYFVDGVTEDLIMGLSKLSNLHVLARHSTFHYKGKQVTTPEIAQEISVRYVLEGSVRKAANRIRVSTELIVAESEDPIWRERYDRELDDIFAVQDDVVKNIVAALDVKLNERDRNRLNAVQTSSLDAYDCVSRGRDLFWRYTPSEVQQAQAQFERAIAMDSNYALAHAWLARAIVLPISFNWSKDLSTLDGAIAHARRALTLQPNLPYAHGITSWSHLWRNELQDSLVEGQLAVDLDPNDFDSHMFYSLALSAGGHGDGARLHADRCIALNPHTPATAVFALGIAHIVTHESDAAIKVLEAGSEQFPNFLPFFIFRAQLYVESGRKDDAIAMIAILHERSGETMRDPSAWKFFIDKDFDARFIEGRDTAIRWYDEKATIR